MQRASTDESSATSATAVKECASIFAEKLEEQEGETELCKNKERTLLSL